MALPNSQYVYEQLYGAQLSQEAKEFLSPSKKLEGVEPAAYVVFSSNDMIDLAEKVSKAMLQGYRPHGAVLVAEDPDSGPLFCQPCIR